MLLPIKVKNKINISQINPPPLHEPAKTWVIRSFVRRLGRITAGQKKALSENNNLLINFSDINKNTNWYEIFNLNQNESLNLSLDIGFGMGDGTIAIAQKNPQFNFLSIDVHTPGIGRLLTMLVANNIKNVRIISGDVTELLTEKLPEKSLAMCKIFFPDPWPKLRHHKRRLICPTFISLLATKMQNQSLLHIATDFQQYAEHINEVFANKNAQENFTQINAQYLPNEQSFLPATKFYKRAIKEGRAITNFYFLKNDL